MILGLDVSNYSGRLTQAQVDCWWDSGIRVVCIGLQNPVIARQQQSMCGRFWREYYVDLPGRDLTIPEAGSQVWVDVETGCFVRRKDVDDEVALIQSLGLLPNIYGNEPSIAPVLGSSQAWSDLPLIYANYPAGGLPPDFNTFNPFNGWTRPRGWQYKGTTDLCGVNVDLDCFEGDYTEPVVVIPDGIGVHYADGSEASVWVPDPARTLDGIGIHFTDGSVRTVWP